MGALFRAFGTSFILGLAFDLAICFGIARYNDPSNWFGPGLILLAILWAVQIALGLRGLLFGILTYYLFRKRQLREGFERLFHEKQYPLFSNFYGDGQEYLQKVTDSEYSSRDQIITAAATLGQIEIVKVLRPSYLLQLLGALDSGFKAYCLHAQRRGQRPVDDDVGYHNDDVGTDNYEPDDPSEGSLGDILKRGLERAEKRSKGERLLDDER